MKVQKFIKATVELLEKIKAKEELPKQRITKYSFKKNGFEIDEEYKVDFDLFVFRHFEEINGLSEFADCAKYILDNPVTRVAMGWVDKEGRPAKDIPLDFHYFFILSSLLRTYLNKVEKLSFMEESFRDVYVEFEKYIYKSILLYKLTAPLRGLSGTIGEVDFGNKLRLRRISDSEKVAYMRMMERPFGFSSGLGTMDIADIRYTLETVYPHRKDTPMSTSSFRASFEDVITALRLFKSGRVDFNVIKTEATSWHPIGGASYGSGFSRQGRTFRGSYELNESEKSDLLRLWRIIRSFRKKTGSFRSGKYLNIALRRFNFGIEESDAENKMIDFLIAFEALYLPESGGELTYRLSNRVAIMLGKKDAKTEKIREFMTTAYNLRSKIVHGKDVRPIKIEKMTIKIKDFAQRVEEYLRESLKSFLILSKTYRKQESIMALLDRSLFDIKSRRKLQRMLRSV